MQIIPVLDLAAGVAVHARMGDRANYAPVTSSLAPEHPGDPYALVRAYREALGSDECYIADLDAIQGGPVQRTLIRELADFRTGFSGGILVDAGTEAAGGALEVLACGVSQIVVGLETLQAFADLASVVDVIGSSRTIFSLDLRLGMPILHPAMQDVHGAMADPMALAAQAVEHGAYTVLVLDIGRVGSGCGVDVGLLQDLRRRFPEIRLLAGGGVLSCRDLARMREVGCDGALVASALHSGRITPHDLATFATSTTTTALDQSFAKISRYMAD